MLWISPLLRLWWLIRLISCSGPGPTCATEGPPASNEESSRGSGSGSGVRSKSRDDSAWSVVVGGLARTTREAWFGTSRSSSSLSLLSSSSLDTGGCCGTDEGPEWVPGTCCGTDNTSWVCVTVRSSFPPRVGSIVAAVVVAVVVKSTSVGGAANFPVRFKMDWMGGVARFCFE